MKLKELADIIGGKISGDPEKEISGISGIKEATDGDITYLSDKKYLADALSSKASAIIVRENIQGSKASFLIVDNPQFAFAKALELFYARTSGPAGISDKAVIGENLKKGKDISIHPFSLIGNNVTLGSGVTVSYGTYIGDNSFIGDGSFIHPNVTIRENVRIGSRVIIHSGAVVGSDGFGYVFEKGRHHKIPHVGGVIIEDDVEIGANTTIDRATTGNTIIGSGTKIDNLVQIAHNVKIGKNCIILSQVGIGGSAEIGNGAILAGQVGVRDHVKIGNGAVAGAQSGIGNDIPDKQIYSGSPAISHKTWLRAQSIYAKLPEYIRRLQELEKKINKEGNSHDG